MKRSWGVGLGAVALVALGFGLGHFNSSAPLAAQQAKTDVVPASAVGVGPRVVAYVHNNLAITRDEFADFLIARYAEEHLQLYVNSRIIEMACAKKGITITPQEIDDAIVEDCKRINVSKDDFIKTVLKTRYKKTIDEWRNDVMRPRLLLAKLCRDSIQVDEEDLKKMFENRYGLKARCKIILWPKDQRNIAQKNYGALRQEGPPENPDLHWNSIATKQPDANLAATAGLIEPIGRFSGPESAKVEEIAFSLKNGEVSPIIELPIGWLVVKRVGDVPPVANVSFEKLRDELRKEVIDRKLEREIPMTFAKLRDEAKPVLLLGKKKLPEPELP